ncbi:hypothetical protein OHD62_29615 [Mesorhizobium sp. YC-39]|uniref:hypothetical protein n=1 Tax=unclassified Mesorhizobium TaxID=325217 RepID=UPI0021E9367F|nr:MULTISPECIES: hypothetical protein [unclassified Mesorhizobium]MCV3210549.1 hypothetical protein [Mesorhizobium sp. YC-2]MCV3232553.1 hypothetical protein [Mesorhizobium sp. YC-39]
MALFWITVYVLFFMHAYITWGSVTFYYFGLWYNYDIDKALLAYGIIALFGCILPISINRYSEFACWIIYLIIFIPAILCVSLQGYTSFSDVTLMLALAVSFMAMVYIPRVLTFRQYFVMRRFQTEWFLFFFIGIYFAAIAYYFYEFRGMLTFSNFDDIYTQRALFAAAAPSALAAYLTGWLTNAMNPYLIAVGLFDRTRRWVLPIAIAGQVLVFMAFAGKAMLVMLFVVVGFYLFALKDGRIMVARLALGAATLALTVSALLVATDYQPTGLALQAVAVIFLRTLALQGAMVGVYADVFSDSPLTYWSHANIINLFIEYPYKAPLGVVVGMRVAGGDGFNANSSFWASDGVAAYGMTGVIIVGIVFGVLLSLANKLVTPERLPFAATMSIPFLMAVANVPLLTGLVTGGGFFLVVMIAYGMPNPKMRRVGRSSRSIGSFSPRPAAAQLKQRIAR